MENKGFAIHWGSTTKELAWFFLWFSFGAYAGLNVGHAWDAAWPPDWMILVGSFLSGLFMLIGCLLVIFVAWVVASLIKMLLGLDLRSSSDDAEPPSTPTG